MFFGDYLYNLDMLESAYYSYAIENVHDDLKKVARFIAIKNTENGFVVEN
nr:HAD hydrolase family protein [uncultured Romboutsia sp.]